MQHRSETASHLDAQSDTSSAEEFFATHKVDRALNDVGSTTPSRPARIARDVVVLEERVQDLEDVSAHLNNEMLLHKKQIELRHSELCRYVDSKLAEISLTMQENQKTVTDRLADITTRLEFAVSTLSQLQIQVLRNQNDWQKTRETDETLQDEQEYSSLKERRQNRISTVDNSAKEIEEVESNYRDLINKIFVYYSTHGHGSNKGRKTMDRFQFCLFIRDFSLCTRGSAELTWTRVLRWLQISENHYGKDSSAELSDRNFAQTLRMLANEIFQRKTTFTEAQKLENLILSILAPTFQRNMPSLATQTHVVPSTQEIATRPEIREMLKKYRKNIKEAFQTYRDKDHFSDDQPGMSLKGLIALVANYDLNALVSKRTLKLILQETGVPRKQRSTLPNSRPEELEVTFELFELVLIRIAEQIFGDDKQLLREYPTPEARLRKLLVKMFLLSS